jgi:transposase
VADVPLAEDAIALRAANARLRGVVEAKDTENAVLRAQLEAYQAQLEELPSAEGLAKPTPRSLRAKSGRKPGRPKGQPGATLEMSDHPDDVVVHEPRRCRSCGAGLSGSPVTRVERRQVTDLPEVIRAVVTEHRLVSRRCACGAVTSGGAPAGVIAPVQYGPRVTAVCAYLWHGQFLSRDRTCQAVAELFGVAVSPGTVATMVRRVAGPLDGCPPAIRAALAAAEVVHFDETGFRVAGKLAWVHSASSGKIALLGVHGKRGRQAMDAAGVLPAFGGIAVHDAWAPYDTYSLVRHALCNAHVTAGGRRRRPSRPMVLGAASSSGKTTTWDSPPIRASRSTTTPPNGRSG